MINNDNISEYKSYFSAFFGPSHEYYTDRLKWYFDGKRNTFNGWAFFFSGYWLLYRKMYREFFLIVGGCIVLGLIAEGLLQTGSIRHSVYKNLDVIYYILVPLVTGYFANGWYIRKSIMTVEKKLNSSDDIAKTKKDLKQEGGTSSTAPVILIIISAIFAVINALGN